MKDGTQMMRIDETPHHLGAIHQPFKADMHHHPQQIMGVTFSFVAIIIETALAILCWVTKSYQEKVRSIIRISALIVFVLLIATSSIQWSFRWYALAALLVVWAILATQKLFDLTKSAPKEYKAGRVSLSAIASLMLVLIALTPALIFPQVELPKPTGEYDVASIEYTYVDHIRQKLRFVV